MTWAWWAWVIPPALLALLGLTAGGRYWWATLGLLAACRREELAIARTMRAIKRRLDSGEGGPRCLR